MQRQSGIPTPDITCKTNLMEGISCSKKASFVTSMLRVPHAKGERHSHLCEKHVAKIPLFCECATNSNKCSPSFRRRETVGWLGGAGNSSPSRMASHQASGRQEGKRPPLLVQYDNAVAPYDRRRRPPQRIRTVGVVAMRPTTTRWCDMRSGRSIRIVHTDCRPQIEIHWGRSRNGNLFKMRLCVLAVGWLVGRSFSRLCVSD